MMKKFIILLLIINVTALFAGDPARKGTTGADQLLIPVGARSIATGGAFVANTTGIESIYYNPAGLNPAESTEAMFSYMNYIADINVSYFAVASSIGELGAIGLSIKTFDFGDIPVTTIEAPDGTGSTYSPSFYTVGLTYSKIITDRVSAGINLKLIHEGIQNAEANGFAMDFGVQYSFGNNLFLGVAVKNIGSNMKYEGSDLQVQTSIPGTPSGARSGQFAPITEEFQIPSYFELSIAYDLSFNSQNSLLLGSSFRNNNALEDKFNFGLEYGFNKIFFVRGGYDMMLENSDESIYGLSFGAGFNYNFSSDLNVTLDYAFREVQEFPTSNHIFTVKLGIK